MMTFSDRIANAIRTKRSILVVGLDPNIEKLPMEVIRSVYQHYGCREQGTARMFVEFNQRVIKRISPYAVAVKPQIAFYEQYGHWGLWAFEETLKMAREAGIEPLTDAKRGDGGDTADAYANGHLGEVSYFDPTPGGFLKSPGPLRTGAMTIHGYIGDDCVTRFAKVAKQHGSGVFVVDKTSFKPNSRLEQLRLANGLTVWQALADLVDEWGAGTEGECGYRNVGVVLGATYPDDASWMRKRLPNSWFLVPGYGAQGGGADEAVLAVNDDGLGCIVNSSRGIIYACQDKRYADLQWEDAVAQAAKDSRDDLNKALKRAGKLSF